MQIPMIWTRVITNKVSRQGLIQQVKWMQVHLGEKIIICYIHSMCPDLQFVFFFECKS